MRRREPWARQERSGRPKRLRRFNPNEWPGEPDPWRAWMLARQVNAALHPGEWPDEVDRAREVRRERQAYGHRVLDEVEAMEQLLAQTASGRLPEDQGDDNETRDR